MPSTVIQHHARLLDDVRSLVRSGHGAIVTFGSPTGTVLELAGPKGMHPGGELCAAPVPTVRLWATWGDVPLAVAAANQDFPAGLATVAEHAGPLVGGDLPALLALLAAVREVTDGMRFRVPTVGDAVIEEGVPTAAAWASCLPLGALQAAIVKASILRRAA